MPRGAFVRCWAVSDLDLDLLDATCGLVAVGCDTCWEGRRCRHAPDCGASELRRVGRCAQLHACDCVVANQAARLGTAFDDDATSHAASFCLMQRPVNFS